MTREIAAKGHSYKSVVTEATCEEQGYTTYTCTCGDEYIDDYVDSLGHSFTEYKSDNNATPEKDGTKTAICDRDGCEATDVIIEKYNKFAQLSYVALGDSITYGYEPFTGRLMENPYPSLVAETLGLKSVLNYGIPGDTVGYHPNWKVMANRYVEMDDEANIVSVLAGINDYRYATIPLGDIDDDTIYTIYGAYNVLAKGLIEKYPDSFIFFMTPYKWADDKGECAQGYSLEDMSNCIKEVCKKYNIPVLDLYTYGELENEFGTSGSDGLHPTQKFLIEKTAPQISEFIESNYGKIDYTIEEEVDYSQLSYTAFGDSITYGIDGVNGGRMASPYPSLVADALGLKAVYNKGISGATYCINNLNRTNMTAYFSLMKSITLMYGIIKILEIKNGTNGNINQTNKVDNQNV
jgi:lysophospholipase L1-like esterase